MKMLFENLSPEENQSLMEALPDITLLVASADGEISGAELDWGRELTRIRSFKSTKHLEFFYKVAHDNFEKNLRHDFTQAHADPKEISALATKHLAKLGPILKKLDSEVAEDLYDSFKSFARHIAKADGGFLGYAAIDLNEKELLDLPMIEF